MTESLTAWVRDEQELDKQVSEICAAVGCSEDFPVLVAIPELEPALGATEDSEKDEDEDFDTFRDSSGVIEAKIDVKAE